MRSVGGQATLAQTHNTLKVSCAIDSHIEFEGHANGSFTRWLETLKNTDVLLLDDWGMTAMDAQTRADLLEIIDDRANAKATIITSQLPIEHWHEWIGDATIADGMLDRLMQNNHRFTPTGESMRKRAATKAKTTPDCA